MAFRRNIGDPFIIPTNPLSRVVPSATKATEDLLYESIGGATAIQTLVDHITIDLPEGSSDTIDPLPDLGEVRP